MPLDAFGEAGDCGPAFWQLCIHPVNILIDKYPKITLKYTKYVSTENMWILRDPLLLSFLTKDDVDRARLPPPQKKKIIIIIIMIMIIIIIEPKMIIMGNSPPGVDKSITQLALQGFVQRPRF